MHNPFDQLAKKVGKEALGPSGVTVVQFEIFRDAQHADIRHDPDPTREAERARLGILGRMAARLCLIEVYGHSLAAEELRACLSKHFAHWSECVHRSRTKNARRKQRDLPPEPTVEPFLWILAATSSAPMLQKLKVDAAPEWPRGVYYFGADLLHVGFVVADELPRDRSTLLVRIMAAGPGLHDAIDDLAALPADAHERAIAEQIMIHLQHALGRKPSRTPDEEEFIVKMYRTWEQARIEARTEALNEGRVEEAARAVLTALRVRGVVATSVDRDRILAEKDPSRLERWLERAILAASIAEVLDEPS